MQKKFKRIPKYSITKEEGPPHEKIYHVSVKISKDIIGNGVGKNKKEAEQEAAKLALENISEND